MSSRFDELVDRILESRTVYDTIYFNRLHGVPDKRIIESLREIHGLNEFQARQALREYHDETGEKELL